MEAKYDKIGINYNQTRKADKYLAERLLYHLSPKVKGIYLDIGCGTGNYTNEFQKKGVQFIGIDPSVEMLNQAEKRNEIIDWRIGTAEATSLPSKSIDGIIGSLTIHHWVNLKDAFSELHRVLKIGGRIVIFTATPEQMNGYWLNHYFPKMLANSIIQMPSYKNIESAMSNNGFEIIKTENYSIKSDLQDKFLYSGKHHPKLYLDETIRQGISSFSALANQQEVETGLKQLQKDIENQKIKDLIKSYEHSLGDYLFIIGRKSN